MRTIAAAISTATIAGALLLGSAPAYAGESELTPVTPLGVGHDDPCGTMNDGFSFPEPQAGVLEYRFSGGMNGSDITVTAILADGYVLAEGAAGEWRFPQMTDVACEQEQAPTDPPAPDDSDVPALAADTAAAAVENAATSGTQLAETGIGGEIFAAAAAGLMLLGGTLLAGRSRRADAFPKPNRR